MKTLAHQVLISLQIDPNAITRKWEPMAVPSKYVGQSEQIVYLQF